MICNKCGKVVNPNQEVCDKCGNILKNNSRNNFQDNSNKGSDVAFPITVTILIIILILALSAYFVVIKTKKRNYYIGESILYEEDNDSKNDSSNTDSSNNTTSNTTNTTKSKGKYKTAIITDNVYTGVSLNGIDDAYELIREDSENQKTGNYSKEMIEIENDIIDKYSITAVNLGEMDTEFARELEDVIKEIYDEYPGTRKYLTNLTLTNLDMSNADVIALFMPVFPFATSNTSTTRPWVIKTQVQLNAKYFLNPQRLDASVATSSKTGHFPKNSSRYSPVAHELGHYLSFIAVLNKYDTDSIVLIEENQMQTLYDICEEYGNGELAKQMLEEAYENYQRDHGSVDFDEWRGQISEYALAKDEQGNYIYDETIAEAFHDVYLNKNDAEEASKYIVEVLKKYIGG